MLRRLLPALGLAGVVALTTLPGAPAAANPIPDPETLVKGDVVRTVLTTQTQDPTSIDVADDGRVVFAERKGFVKVWHQSGRLVEAGRIGVDAAASQCGDCPGRGLDEGGLHGLVLAPDFLQTGNLYLYYSVPNSKGVAPVPPKMPGARGPQSTEGKFRLSRFTLRGDVLDKSSEVHILENPAEWDHCCHYGGDMEWLPDGTMLLSTGDDTISSQSGGFAPRDDRLGREFNNAELTSQNLADRRGKLLRLDPEDVDGDGSVVPTDNPFRADPAADPFVYALGFRSNYRFGMDAQTGFAYVGTVGPDGKVADPNRGPAAHEDLEVVPAGGGTNHGWPRCIADNIPYHDYDFTTGQNGPPLSCEGMTPASVWYTYQPGQTSPFLTLGAGGTCNAIMGGHVYHRGDKGALRLPERFDKHLIWMEWCRGIALSTPVKSDGQLDARTDTVKVIASGFRSPADTAIGPDGAVYVAEYAARNYNASNSVISRLQCGGCSPTSADYAGNPPVADPVSGVPVSAPAASGGAGLLGQLGTPAAVGAPLALLGLVWAGRRRRTAVV